MLRLLMVLLSNLGAEMKTTCLFTSIAPSRLLREFRRLFSNHRWDVSDDGDILIGGARIGGVFECEAPDGLGVIRTKNLITTEGGNYLLSAGIAGGTQYATFYVAPFSGAASVTGALTAANFASTQTEITTGYSEANRVAYVESVPSGMSLNNTSNPATVTAAIDNLVIRGVGLLSTATKGATTGVLLAAANYTTARTLPTTGDTLGVKYTLSLTAA